MHMLQVGAAAVLLNPLAWNPWVGAGLAPVLKVGVVVGSIRS